jgi:hypothetical protein
MKPNELDETAKSNIERARSLIKQAADIVRRTKVSDRALEFLGYADFNLRHPQPVLLSDKPAITDDFDWGHLYVTLDEACALTELSRTTIRKLVNEEWMPQPHRGLYGLQHLLRGVDEYFRFGGGE